MNALNEFVYYSKYAKFLPSKGRKETLEESQDDIIYNTHIKHLEANYPHALENSVFNDMLLRTRDMMLKLKVFGSQRALQFRGPKILNRNERIFNCVFGIADKDSVFKDLMWILLAGCGATLRIDPIHVNKLSTIKSPKGRVDYIITDDCEGFAYAVDKLMKAYFNGDKLPIFNYSQIRPAGAPISGGYLAPGPVGLRTCLDKIRILLDNLLSEKIYKLRPIHVYQIACYIADSVLAGGVRRSALGILFAPEDEEMRLAKTGNWFVEHPEYARSNNSIAFNRSTFTKDELEECIKAAKEFGEPGFALLNGIYHGLNPCFEVSFDCFDIQSQKTGWGFCNLCTISGKDIENKEDFYEACRCAAFIGTIQASYNKFPFLGEITERIFKRDALLGVSISGIMTNPDLFLNKDVLATGAKIVKDTNAAIAKILGINAAKRTTLVKPKY